MRQRFIERSFSEESRAIIAAADKICREYTAQGYDLSLRQLYYQFVSRQPLAEEWANSERNYKRLGNIVSDARLAGLLDWDWIKDRGRETVENPHWDSPAEILEGAAGQFRIDLWDGQPNHVELMVEKQALEGVLQPVCLRLDIPFTANKGYSSSSAMYEIGQRLLERAGLGQELHVIYLGDHDPSGIDMTRDVQERLELFSGCTVYVHRVALNMDQVRLHNPPENPTKMTDSRANGYVREFGHSCWELDALDPSTLARIVEEEVRGLRDDYLFDARVAQQMRWRDELLDFARTF